MFFYNRRERQFHLLFSGSYAACCLTHVAHVPLAASAAAESGLFFLCSAGTDGYLALWDVTSNLRDRGIFVEGGGGGGEEDALHIAAAMTATITTAATTKTTTTATTTTAMATKALLPPRIRWQQRVRAHAGAVMCMDTVRVAPHDVFVASGGDDGSVCLTRYALDPSSPTTAATTTTTTTMPSCSQTLMVRAHACAVTAVALLPRTASRSSLCMATSGNDKRLKVWSLATATAAEAATSTRGRGELVDCGASSTTITTTTTSTPGNGNGNGNGDGSGSGSSSSGDDDNHNNNDIVNVRLQADEHTAVADVSAMVAVLLPPPPASPPLPQLLRHEQKSAEEGDLSSSLILCGVGIDQWGCFYSPRNKKI